MADDQLPARIFHLTTTNAWGNSKASGIYKPPMLAETGYLHASFDHQFMNIANTVFRGHKDILLLEIDAGKLTSEVKNEDLRRGGAPYPHIYGPINCDAVIAVHPIKPRADGTFAWPEALGPEVVRTPRKQRI